jgi:ribosomal protein L40E
MRIEAAQVQHLLPQVFQQAGNKAAAAEIQVECRKCGAKIPVQARFDRAAVKKAGTVQFPDDNLLKCPGHGCTETHNLLAARQQLEAQLGRPMLKQA